MKCGIQKILIWILSFSLILPSFSVSAYASEITQELDVSFSEENEESQVEIIKEEKNQEEDAVTSVSGKNIKAVTPVKLNTELAEEIVQRAMLGIETYQREVYIADLCISSEEQNEVYELCKQTILDNPQYFWIDELHGSCWVSLDENNPSILGVIEFYHTNEYCKSNSWKIDIEKVDKARNALMSEVAYIRAGLPENATDIEKAFHVYNYLVENVEYDDDLANSNVHEDPGYTAYGALVNHKAVCQGYMLAYTLLMRYFDVEVMNVVSPENNHGWNVIKLGSDWYYVDCTWKIFLKTEHELRVIQGSTSDCTNANATWYLYSGRDLIIGGGNPNLPPVPETNAYANYTFGGRYFIDGYWITTLENTLTYQSLDGKENGTFEEEGSVTILNKYMHKLYYAVWDNSGTYRLKYFDASALQVYDTGARFSDYPEDLQYKNGSIYSSDGRVIYTLPNGLSDVIIDKPLDLEYEVGDVWNPAGLQVYAIRENRTITRLLPSQYEVRGFDSSTAGNKRITVSYTEGGITLTKSFQIKVTQSTSETGLHVKQSYYILNKIGDMAQIQAEVRGDSSATITYRLNCDCYECTDCYVCEVCSHAREIVQITPDGELTAVGKGYVSILVSSETDTKAVYVTVYEPSTDSFVGDDNGEGGVETPEEGFTFTYSYNASTLTATVTGISGRGTKLEIPSTTMLGNKEYTVTAIAIKLWSDETSADIIRNQITSVVIPDSVKRIGASSFSGEFGTTTNLKSVTLPKECVIESNAFSYTGLESLTLGSGITLEDQYGSSAFYGCTSLKELTLDVERIGSSCFSGCTSLTTINFGNNVKTIGQHAFYECSALKELILPEGLQRIENYAFYNCYLDSLTIPKTVTHIGTNVIYDYPRNTEEPCVLHLYCTEIETVEYMKNSQIYYIFHGDFTENQINMFKMFGDPFRYEVVDGNDPGPSEKDEDSTIFTEKNIYLKPGEYYQLKSGYYDLESLVLENNGEAYYSVDEKGLICAKEIGDSIISAYDTNGNFLEAVNVFVYEFAFSQDHVQMQIGETITLAVQGRPSFFEGSSNFDLMTCTIDGSGAVRVVSVENTEPMKYENNSLGTYGLVKIEAVDIGNSTLTMSTRNDKITASCYIEVNTNRNTFSDNTYYYRKLKDGTLAITGVVEDAQGYWFNDYSSSYVKNIESQKKTIITVPSEVTFNEKTYKVTEIAANAINDGDFEHRHFVTNPAMTYQMILEEGIEKIDNFGMANLGIQEIVLPSTLKEIGMGGLAYNQLESIVIPASVTSLGDGALVSYTLKDAIILANIEHLPDGLFYNCINLKTVTLPNTVKVIGLGAFENCTALESITLPNSVERLERYAFRDNKSLSMIILSENLTYIDNEAFKGCSGLKEVYLLCPNLRAIEYTYLFESAYRNISFYVSTAYDNTKMLENLCLTDYVVLDAKTNSLSLSGKSAMEVGEEQKLTVQISPENYFLQNSLSWTSNNPAVATVFHGMLKGISEGKATITATSFDGKSASFEIHVFADSMEEKITAEYEDGIHVFTNVVSTLADIKLKDGWYFTNTTQKLTASENVQYFEAYYMEEGVKRECELPIYAAHIDSVSITGRNTLAKGNSAIYRVVLNGTGISDKFALPKDRISWNMPDAAGMTCTVDEESGNLIGKAKTDGNYVIGVTVKLSDALSFNNQLNVNITAKLDDNAYGAYDNPDFSVKNENYNIGYRILDSGTEVEVVSVSGHNTSCVIPASVTYNDTVYTVTKLNIYKKSASNAGREVSKLILPGTITEIQPGSFKNFELLNSITISGTSDRLKVGSDGALYNTDQSYLFWLPWGGNNADKFIVPASVEDMDSYELCAKITRLQFEEGCKLQIRTLTDDDLGIGYGGIYTADGKKMLKAPYQIDGVMHIPYGVEEIAPYSCYSLWAPEIHLPSTVSVIDSYAFYDTENGGEAQKVYFEEGSCLSQINAYAFQSAGITHIHLPKSVDYIGKCAFNGVIFEEFSVDGTITTIREDAFPEYYELVDLYEIYKNPDIKLIKDDNNISYLANKVDRTASVVRFAKDTMGTLIIPENVIHDGITYEVTRIERNIGAYGMNESLYSSKKVTAVQIPASVKEIDNFAFNVFSNLCRVEFAPDSKLKTIGEYAFYNCSSLQTILLPDTVTSVEECTDNSISKDPAAWDRFLFTNHSIKGLEAFAGTIKTVGTDIYESDGYYWEKDGSSATVFYVSGEADNVVPDEFVSDGIKYPVTSLRKYAFAGTLSEEVILPKGLEIIGQGAFLGSSLYTIKIPAGVEELGLGAFVNSYDLQNIVYDSKTVPSFTTGVVTTFEGCPSLEIVVVPEGTKNTYKDALNSAFTDSEPYFVESADYVELTDFEVTDAKGTAVKSLNLTIGDKMKLSISPNPANTTDSTAPKWNVQDNSLLNIRDNTFTALAAGKTVLKATVAGITKEIPVSITEVEKQIVDLEAPVMIGTLDEKNRVSLSWNAINGADGFALYRSLSPDSGFVRVKIKLSGNRTTTLDTNTEAYITYYYKLVGYKQNADGTFDYGAESNVVSVNTTYVGEFIPVTGVVIKRISIEPKEGLLELNEGESCEIVAGILPENHTEDVYIRYTSENPKIIDLDKETGKWVAKKGGNTNIRIEVVYSDNDSVLKTLICPINVIGEEISYFITYNLNGGVNNSENPTSYTESMSTITLKNPNRTGYTFDGWYNDSTFKTKVTTINKGSTGNKVFYAKWKANKYNITYKLNGGKSNPNPSSYTIATSDIKLQSPKRTGYTFKGWYSDSKLKNKVTVIKKGSTGNKTLYAKWEAKKYTIKYNLNKGKNSSKNPKSYKITTSTITLKKPTRKGYKFVGWYSDKKCTKKVTNIKKGSTGNKTLYAKWKKK